MKEDETMRKSNALILKWKKVLDYTGKNIYEISDSDTYLFVAEQMEKYENAYKRYPNLLKKFIILVRTFEGKVNIEYDMVDSCICLITNGFDENDEYSTIAIPFEKIDDVTSMCYHPKGYYVLKNDKWRWI